MKTTQLIVAIFLVPQLMAFDAGFKAGSSFTAFNIEGALTVSCPGEIKHFSCRGYDLNPAMRSRFYSTSGVDADKVNLVVTRANGSTKDKSSKFNSETGESKKSFNLWIRTLFQRPLLKLGVNTVTYELLKDDQVVESGEFTVNVEKGETKYCDNGWYRSSTNHDCSMQSTMCSRYINDPVYCR